MAHKSIFHDKNGEFNRRSFLGVFIGIGIGVITDILIIGPVLTANNISLNLINLIVAAVPIMGAIIGGVVGKNTRIKNIKTHGSISP